MLRRKNEAVHSGAMTMLDTSNTKVLSYLRKGSDGKAIVVALNFTGEPQTISFDAGAIGGAKLSTIMTDAGDSKTMPASAGMTLPDLRDRGWAKCDEERIDL